MELTIAAFLQLRVLTFSSALLTSSSVCGILFAGFGVFFPVLAFLIVKKYDTRPAYVKLKFSTLIEEYKLNGTIEKFFTVMYIARNLVVAVALVYLQDYAYIQIGILIGLNFGFAFLIWRYKPYAFKVSNISNFVSELVFALVHILIFVLIHDQNMHFFDDPQRIIVGWIIMGCCGVILMASLVLAFAQQYFVIKKTINLVKKFLKKTKTKKSVELKVKKLKRINEAPGETGVNSTDLADLSSADLISLPGALNREFDLSRAPSQSHSQSDVTSTIEDRKLVLIQRLARLNFESRHNKIRLGRPVLNEKKKKKPKCAL